MWQVKTEKRGVSMEGVREWDAIAWQMWKLQRRETKHLKKKEQVFWQHNA